VRFYKALMVLFLIISQILGAKEPDKAQKPKKPSHQIIAPKRRNVPGKRFPLSLGELYVPDFFTTQGQESTELVFFFHGAAWCAEQNFYDAKKNAVIVSITVKNYGYPQVFKYPQALKNLIEEISGILKENQISEKPVTKLCLASFSGGYSAIREILKHEETLPLVTDVVLADSLYAPRIKETDAIDTDALAPFLRFCERAARGEVNFFFSQLYPPEEKHRNNTTTLTAAYLISQLGAEKKDTSTTNSIGMQLLYRADKGNFHVLGYSGMTMQDHLNHFYSLSELLAQTSLTPAKKGADLHGFETSPFWGEQIETIHFEPEARIHINAPCAKDFDPSKPVRIIFFALPNGNTIEQTIGKKVTEGVDWHFGIQHIGAQTRRLREVIKEENIIVAYLEAAGKSWPLWRKKHPEHEKLIQKIINTVTGEFKGMDVKIHLSGHSGGGSFVFGYINSVESIPDQVQRISFLDSNYSYNDGKGHGKKLIDWIKQSPDHKLVVICYDDRNVRYKGKLIVGPTGGTFRRTRTMVQRIGFEIELVKTEEKEIIRHRDKRGQIDIILHKNPENKILHTVLVGDMNGLIHAETSGTKYENMAGIFGGALAYEKWIQPE